MHCVARRLFCYYTSAAYACTLDSLLEYSNPLQFPKQSDISDSHDEREWWEERIQVNAFAISHVWMKEGENPTASPEVEIDRQKCPYSCYNRYSYTSGEAEAIPDLFGHVRPTYQDERTSQQEYRDHHFCPFNEVPIEDAMRQYVLLEECGIP